MRVRNDVLHDPVSFGASFTPLCTRRAFVYAGALSLCSAAHLFAAIAEAHDISEEGRLDFARAGGVAALQCLIDPTLLPGAVEFAAIGLWYLLGGHQDWRSDFFADVARASHPLVRVLAPFSSCRTHSLSRARW